MGSVTNELSRRLALAAFLMVMVWGTLDGLAFFDVNETVVVAVVGLVPLLLGIPTYRNVKELENDPDGYRAEHEGY